MPELRRLAVVAENPARLAEFYRDVFDLKNIGAAKGAVFLSDGNFNLALVPAEESTTPRIRLLGFPDGPTRVDREKTRTDSIYRPDRRNPCRS